MRILTGKVRTTHAARTGAYELILAFSELLDVVIALTPADFYKSMATHSDHTVWQDVYRPSTQASDLRETRRLASPQVMQLLM